MRLSDPLQAVEEYYSRKVLEHGPTPQGADWRDEASQLLRFRQLLLLVDRPGSFSLLDYGCGYGGLIPLVQGNSDLSRYVGLDISQEMLEHARARFGADPRFVFVGPDEEVSPADFTIASGIFNVRLNTSNPRWQRYVTETIDRLAELGNGGFAFNMLTSSSDPEHRRSDLFYADPMFFFAYCKERHGQEVALLQDYGLYEFTILVRKDPRR